MPDENYDIETQPFTDGTGTNEPSVSAPRGGKMPPLNLSRAQHILDRFTEDPSWLANPHTSHVANTIFSAATKIVGMNIQMERVNTQAEVAKFKYNTDNRLLLHLNDGIAKVRDMTAVAEIQDEVKANGPSPRAISLLNAQLKLQEDATAAAKLSDKKELIGVRTDASKSMEDVRFQHQKELQALRAPKAGEPPEVAALRKEHAVAQKSFDTAKAQYRMKKGTSDETGTQAAYNSRFVSLKEKEDELDAAIQKYESKKQPAASAPDASAPDASAPAIKRPTKAIAADYVQRLGREKAIEALKQEGYDTSGYAD